MGAVATVLAIVSPFARRFDPQEATSHKDFWDVFDRYGVAWACIGVFWAIVGLRILWAPYFLYEGISRTLRSKQEELDAAVNDKVELKISAFKSPASGSPAYFINIKNTHSWKTAKKVKVFLDSVENADLGQQSLANVAWPRRLPLRDEFNLRDCDIDAAPSSQDFELFFARSQVGAAWFLVFAPSAKGLRLDQIQNASNFIIHTRPLSLKDADGGVAGDDEFLVAIRAQGEDIKPESTKFRIVVPNPEKGFHEPTIAEFSPTLPS